VEALGGAITVSLGSTSAVRFRLPLSLAAAVPRLAIRSETIPGQADGR
jgi:hypothetical protein